MKEKNLLKTRFFKKDYNSKKSYIQSELVGNTIINDYNGQKEIIIYKADFIVPKSTQINKDIDRSRKFFYNENKRLQPKEIDNIENLLQSLESSLFNSRKRTLDNLYGYALSNTWNYFITLTFDTSIDRHDIDCVNYAWQKFKKKLQYYFPNIKIILIPEGHPTSGAIHFHGLIGNADFDKYLIEARNNKKLNKDKTPNKHYGELLKTKHGYQIYNFIDTFYTCGFSTVVKIDRDTPQKKIINYLSKYISKETSTTNVRYNKKSYYCTRNLIAKEKQVCYLEKEQLQEFISKAELTKQTTRFVVYEL